MAVPVTHPLIRLIRKSKREGECYVFTGANRKGYGAINIRGRVLGTHVVAYRLIVGPIPKGLELDHLCRNTRCWRPSHLEPVTHIINTKRGIRGDLTTHCPQGHEYTEANTGKKNGRRTCKCCNADRQRAIRLARKEGRRPKVPSG